MPYHGNKMGEKSLKLKICMNAKKTMYTAIIVYNN